MSRGSRSRTVSIRLLGPNRRSQNYALIGGGGLLAVFSELVFSELEPAASKAVLARAAMMGFLSSIVWTSYPEAVSLPRVGC
jgi:hypothetical protein